MKLNVSKKIAYSELLIAAMIFTTLIPYIIFNMNYSAVHLFHYVNITMLILAPLGFLSLFYLIDRWECRPIEMLSFYLERGLEPPEDIIAAATIRTLNLPLVHSASILIRYEIIVLLDCLYMGFVADLPLRENIRLGLYAGVGLSIFPLFSFFLTERLLLPVRGILAEKTKNIRIDDSKVIKITTRTRLVAILLATVIAPLIALGELVYRRMSTELGIQLGGIALVQPLMDQMQNMIFTVTGVAIVMAAGIGILLASSISDPLGRIVHVIREIEQGNLKARSHHISNDEIGGMSQSFDRMAQELDRNRAELENLNRNLEFRVTEKTQNLTRAYERLQFSNQNLAVANRELEEANKKLMELDRLKSDFISIVSHELRTPLTSIKAFAELILMKPNMAAERQKKLLGIINTETDRLARLINDILDLTKIEAGKLSWHITKVSIEQVVRDSVSGIQSLADTKSLSLAMKFGQDLPEIPGDRDRLIQVMTNILSNAIKFTPQGGRVQVNVFFEQMDRPRIVVEVSDTGVGIPQSELDHIFEKFHRSGDLLTNTEQGTGLGLSITRQIVEYHGGSIWATSEQGYGSTFTFTLPLDKVWGVDGI